MKNKNVNRVAIPLVLIVGIFIGGVVVLRTKGIGAAILSEGKKVFVPVADDPEADPDNDGLKNWQEKIYKTDTRNPDTDGDGYLDGEEVGSGYDPAISSPNDALEGTDTNQPRPLPKNLTDYLAQILTQKISSGEIAPAKGEKLDSNDPNTPYNQEILQEALAQINLRAKEYFVLPEIKIADIKVHSSPTTNEIIGAYISTMSRTVSRSEGVKQLNKSEATIIQETIKNKDVTEINVLLMSVQKNIIDTKNVTAPQGFEKLHAQQIALLMLEEKILDAVKHFDQDPATAIAGLETYQQFIITYQAFSEELNAKIQSYQ